jgi:hypothetical protein
LEFSAVFHFFNDVGLFLFFHIFWSLFG